MPEQRNKGGRPKCPVPGVQISTFLRVPEVDAINRIARRNDVSVSERLRTLIRRGLRQGGVEPLGKIEGK